MFAGVGLVLVTIGVYSVIAYTVSQQIHEIGIRMALGAQRADVLRLIVRMTPRLVVIGVVLGLLGSLGVMKVLASQLWGVSPRDPVTLATVVSAMSLAALAASYLPARRAMSVNPIVALRGDDGVAVGARAGRRVPGRAAGLRRRLPGPVLFGQTAFLASVLIASAVMPFLLAIWVGRRIESRFVLHGALVGLVAALIYTGLAWGQPQRLLYRISHGLKVAGGAVGGVVAARRKRTTVSLWRVALPEDLVIFQRPSYLASSI